MLLLVIELILCKNIIFLMLYFKKKLFSDGKLYYIDVIVF